MREKIMEPVTYELLKEAIDKEFYSIMPRWMFIVSSLFLIISGVLYYIMKKQIDKMFSEQLSDYDRLNKQILYKNQKRYDDEKKVLSDISRKSYEVLKLLVGFRKYQGMLTQDQEEDLKIITEKVQQKLEEYIDMCNTNAIEIPNVVYDKYDEFQEKTKTLLFIINKNLDNPFESIIICSNTLEEINNIEQMNKNINASTRLYIESILEDTGE